MGCSSSFHHLASGKKLPFSARDKAVVSVSLSCKTKNILRESWKLVEPVKTEVGKAMFMRIFQTHPNIQDTFPSFQGVTLDELMNSRSLYFHVKRVMAIIENTICSLDDAEVLIESLTNLGQIHHAWSITREHFMVFVEALLWTLQDVLKTECTIQVVEAWKELFNFITKTMLNGLGETAGNDIVS